MPEPSSSSPLDCHSERAGTVALPLFRDSPLMEEVLPHVKLGLFPTPVERLESIEDHLNLSRLYIKRDDHSGVIYGGNKVRKLEFLLARALRAHAREVVTVGFAGSNHALATAIYVRRLGLNCISMLLPQANAHYVRRNLLAGLKTGAELMPYRNFASLSLGMLGKFSKGWMRNGRLPAYIPPGGSCALGAVGYVNAAFELKRQIERGELPEPDFVYVPFGSMGTSVGLALGLKAAGLKSRVVAIRVIEARLSSARKAESLFHAASLLLQKIDPAFPSCSLGDTGYAIRDEFLGTGYAHFTRNGVTAAALMNEQAGIILNGSYSAKAFSAILADAQEGRLRGKTVLFWNTYNSRDLSSLTTGADYRRLPRPFHRYFEEEVQALDQDGMDK